MNVMKSMVPGSFLTVGLSFSASAADVAAPVSDIKVKGTGFAVWATVILMRHVCRTFMAALLVGAAGAFFSPQASAQSAEELLPNGGFEWVETLDPQWVRVKATQGFTLPAENPQLPVSWNLDKPGSFKVVGGGEVHGGKSAFAVTGGQISVGWIETEPQGEWTFTLWARGKGVLTAEYEAVLPESDTVGNKTEPAGTLNLTDQWGKLSQTRRFPANYRRVRVRINVTGSATIDDVSLTSTGRSTSPVGSLKAVPVKDAQTTFLDHMDGALTGQVSTERVVEFVPGAFGKGANLGVGAQITYGNDGSITAPEGTVEFWMRPNPKITGPVYLMLVSGDVARMEMTWRGAPNSISASWGNIYDRKTSIGTGSLDFVDRSGGQDWHHLAYCWDSGISRLYYDGLLVGLDDKAGTALVNTSVSRRIQLGSEYYATSNHPAFDELRFSKTARYGVPGRGKPVAVSSSAAGARPFGEIPAGYKIRKPELDQYRASSGFENSMDANGCYVYGAQLAAPLPSLEDPSGRDKLVFDSKEMPAGVVVGKSPNNYLRSCWTLGKITPDKYVIGIQIRSDAGGDPLAAGANINGSDAPRVFADGQLVSMPWMTAPVELRAGEFIAEIRSRGTVPLKPGSRIWFSGVSRFFANLILYSKAPDKAPLQGGERYDSFNTAHEMWSESWELIPGGAKLRLLNHSGKNLNLSVDAEAVEYYGRKVANIHRDLNLADLARAEIELKFEPPKDSPHCRVEVVVKDIESGRFRRHAQFVRSPVSEGARRRVLLNGQWDAMPVSGTLEIGQPPPSGAVWKTLELPTQLTAPVISALAGQDKVSSTHVVWFRKKLTPPPWLSGERISLELERSSFETRVFVNGAEVGRHMMFAPCSFDVTGKIRQGQENEILIAVRDTFTAAAEPAVIAGADPAKLNPTRWLYPSWWDWGVMGDISIVTRPAVHLEDVQIMPSVRDKSLTVAMTVGNQSGKEFDGAVSLEVLDAGVKVLSMPARNVKVPAGGSAKVSLSQKWENPTLWEPGRPHLYELRVALPGGDLWRGRFGFRESWQVGHLFFLNGTPAKYWRIGVQSYLLEQSDNFRGRIYEEACRDYQFAPGNYMVRMRGFDSRILEICDEAGMPVQSNIGFHSGGAGMIASDPLWANVTRLAVDLAKTTRNHPSAVMYESFNEINWGFTSVFSDGITPLDSPDDPGNMTGHRIEAVLKAVREADPQRPITSDANGDLGGLWDTYDCHYTEGGGNADIYGRTANPASTPFYFPDSAYYRPITGNGFKTGQDIRLFATLRRFGEKPVTHGEVGEYHVKLPVDGTLIAGDRAYGDWYYSNGRLIGLLDKFVVDGTRDLESSMVHPWENTNMQGPYFLSHPPVCATLLNTEGNYRAGEQIQKFINIHHDVWVKEKLTFRWSLEDRAGKVFAGETKQLDMEPSGLERLTLSFKAPATERRLDLTLRLILSKDSGLIREEKSSVSVFPASVPLRIPEGTALYDPRNTTAPVLERMGGRVPVISVVTPQTLSGLKTLLIGKDGVDADLAAAYRPIMDFVAKGGRVICFEQTSPPQWLPLSMNVGAARRQSIHFPRVPGHPVLAGVVERDLRFWRPDRCVAKAEYRKPSVGDVLPIVDSGGRLGLEWTALAELRHGEGSYVLSQLSLIERAEVDPVAALILGNMLNYADSPVYGRGGKAALVGDPAGTLASTARRLRLELPLIGVSEIKDLKGIKTVIVDGRNSTPPDLRKACVELARCGATLVLHDLTPSTCGEWAQAAGLELSLRLPSSARSRGHVMLKKVHPLLDGLSGHELCWQISEIEDAKSVFEVRAIDKLVEYECVPPASGEVLSFPAALVRVPLGSGEILVDQLRWDKANAAAQPLGDRIGSLILANAGARFRPLPPPISLPKKMTFQTVDLATAEQSDIRSMGPPDGTFSRLGAPFNVSGNCVSVKADAAPKSVSIPVGRTVEAFYFLHAARPGLEASQRAGRYVAVYADGSQESMELVGDRNIRRSDAVWPQAEFSIQEPDEATQLAWTGIDKAGGIQSAYATRWSNPRPLSKVKSLRVESEPGCSGLTLLSLVTAQSAESSTAEKAVTGTAAPSGFGTRPKAKALASEGMVFQRAGKGDQARLKFEAAIAADPTYAQAYWLLGVLHLEARKTADAEAAFRKQTQIDPGDISGWNSLGQLQLSQERWDEALASFEKSMAANWNQPETNQEISKLRDRKNKR